MAMSWALKRQLKIFIYLAIFVFAAVGIVIYFFQPAPTCYDKILNQHEERVDCGGECEACVVDPQNLIVYWTRPFEVSPGIYEVASMVENPNLKYGAREISYRLKLYDDNVLVGEKNGKTFLNPRDKFLIYESDIALDRQGVPDRAQIEFDDVKWKVFEKERPNILVSSSKYELTQIGNGRLKVVLRNQTIFAIQNIFIYSVLLNFSGNAVGVSSTVIDSIPAETSRDIFFTWRHPFDPRPASVEVYLRTNLTQ